MDELIKHIENYINVLSLKMEQERSALNIKLNYASETNRFIRLTELSISLEKWNEVHRLLLKYQNGRCRPIEKKSDLFIRIMEVERKGVPGFISVKTKESMIDYMKQLEWKIDELNGMWKS